MRLTRDRQRNRVHDKERVALGRCAARLRPEQNDLQPVRALEPHERVHQQDLRRTRPQTGQCRAYHNRRHAFMAARSRPGIKPKPRKDATLLRTMIVGALLLYGAPNGALGQVLCEGKGTTDEVKPIPQSLVPAATVLFGSSPEETVYRCMNNTVYVCQYCNGWCCDKPDVNERNPRVVAAVRAYCRENPGSGPVPKAVTGHATIYSWRCEGSRAEVDGVEKTDARGFRADMWVPLGGVR